MEVYKFNEYIRESEFDALKFMKSLQNEELNKLLDELTSDNQSDKSELKEDILLEVGDLVEDSDFSKIQNWIKKIN
jgi:hypothetical protein